LCPAGRYEGTRALLGDESLVRAFTGCLHGLLSVYAERQGKTLPCRPAGTRADAAVVLGSYLVVSGGSEEELERAAAAVDPTGQPPLIATLLERRAWAMAVVTAFDLISVALAQGHWPAVSAMPDEAAKALSESVAACLRCHRDLQAHAPAAEAELCARLLPIDEELAALLEARNELFYDVYGMFGATGLKACADVQRLIADGWSVGGVVRTVAGRWSKVEYVSAAPLTAAERHATCVRYTVFRQGQRDLGELIHRELTGTALPRRSDAELRERATWALQGEWGAERAAAWRVYKASGETVGPVQAAGPEAEPSGGEGMDRWLALVCQSSARHFERLTARRAAVMWDTRRLAAARKARAALGPAADERIARVQRGLLERVRAAEAAACSTPEGESFVEDICGTYAAELVSQGGDETRMEREVKRAVTLVRGRVDEVTRSLQFGSPAKTGDAWLFVHEHADADARPGAITEEDRWLGELVAAVRQRGLTKAGLEAMG
jgi:hypothetical protein